MHRSKSQGVWLLAMLLYLALGFMTSGVLYSERTRLAAELLRSGFILVATCLLALMLRRRYAVSFSALLVAWYFGTQIGTLAGWLRFGVDTALGLLPTSLSLGLVAPAGEAWTLTQAAATFLGYTLAIASLWTGYAVGRRSIGARGAAA